MQNLMRVHISIQTESGHMSVTFVIIFYGKSIELLIKQNHYILRNLAGYAERIILNFNRSL